VKRLIEIMDVNDGNRLDFMRKIRRKSDDHAEAAAKVVDEIIKDVRTRGDEALFYYTEKFDKVKLDPSSVIMDKDEIAKVAARLDTEQYAVIARAAERIERFHNLQKQKSWFETRENGEILGQLVNPVESVGAYVPGGTQVLSSSLLMNVIPAKVAGVKNVAVCTPPDKNGEISPALCAAAKIAGAERIYKVGGAQAIAALAYGTETVKKADKVVGPGNIYVALAKKAVFGQVGIDSVAGPSEIAIIADENANPAYVAADLLSQAEHDVMARAICITTSKKLADAIKTELENQIKLLSRSAIAEASVRDNGIIAVVKDIDTALCIANEIAPEHLELCIENPFAYLPFIKNAGAVFLGAYSPEPVGDYYAGPNHVLPTGESSRFFSPLSVEDFVKKTSIISFSKAAFEQSAPDIIKFAEMEGLGAHAESIKIRLREEATQGFGGETK